MPSNYVLTVTGPDRIGIVEEATGLVLGLGGNVETSRMARLGGEFAMLMLVSMPAGASPGLEEALGPLAARGYRVAANPAESAHAEARRGWPAHRIEVQGADHEGIIHEVARYLSGRGISIESVESESSPAPTSGVPLFSMVAEVVVPPDRAAQGWQAGLEEIGRRLNLDITVTP